MSNIVFVPYVSIRPNMISLYSLPEMVRTRTKRQRENEENLKNNSHKGLISWKAKKRINNAIAWLLESADNKRFYSKKHQKHFNFKINFVTLTLASTQIHDDRVIKKELLNNFLTGMKQKWKVENYIWRAEPQKNGNIHFHLITDKFIPYWELRKYWNKVQNKLGYVDRFFDIHGHNDPNTADVRSVKKVKKLQQYLAKYCTKVSKIREIKGKQWGLSYTLSRMKSAVAVPTNKMYKEIDLLMHVFKKEIIKYEYAQCIFVDVNRWKNLINGELYKLFNTYAMAGLNPKPT